MINFGKTKKKFFLNGRSMTLIIIIGVIFVAMSLIKGELFYSLTNISTIFSNLSYDLLLACGMTFVLILGGIDLSVGSVLAFSGIVMTMLLNKGTGVAPAIAIGFAVALLAGGINGLLVAKFNVAPFVATLSTMSALRGAGYVLTSGFFVVGLPEAYIAIGRNSLFGVPNKIIISLAIMLILGVLSTRNRAFKQMCPNLIVEPLMKYITCVELLYSASCCGINFFNGSMWFSSKSEYCRRTIRILMPGYLMHPSVASRWTAQDFPPPRAPP